MFDCELFKNNCLVRIKSFNRAAGRRKMQVTREIAEKFLGARNGSTDEEWNVKVNDAMKRLSASSKLILCPELEKVSSFQAKLRSDALRRYCNQSGIDDGLYLIKTALVPELKSFLTSAEETLQGTLIPDLQNVWSDQVIAVSNLYGSAAVRGLPLTNDLPQCFGTTFTAIQFTVPEGLPPEIAAEEEKKLRESFESARLSIVAALWEEFQKLVDHLVERLEPGENGKAKTFQKGTIENIASFIEAFGNRNAFNDVRLAAAVSKADEILKAIGTNAEIPKKLRDEDEVRAAARDAFGVLKINVDAGVQEVASRAFNFTEE